MRMRIICLITLVSLSIFSANGQLSIDVGYTGSTFAVNNIRPIINAFNSYIPSSAKKMRKMNYMNGLHFSVSTTDFPVNVFAEYNGTFVSLSAKRLINNNNSQYNYILNYSSNAVGPGLIFGSETLVKGGATLLYDFISIKQYTTDDRKRTILKSDKLFSIKPFIDFRLGDEQDRVNASLRFFANIPLKKTDLSNVATSLDPENRAKLDYSDLNSKLTTFGISFILHNKRY